MRAGEFTCPSVDALTLDMLSLRYIAVDSYTTPTHLTVLLKTSKTDLFGVGVTLHMGSTGDILCPMAVVLGLLAIRPSSPGPLFLFNDGSVLSWARLVQALHQALHAAGVGDSRFSKHSFRIGAATTPARMGLPDSLIRMLER